MNPHELERLDALREIAVQKYSKNATPVPYHIEAWIEPDTIGLRELALELQLEKISKNAIKNSLSYRPKPIRSHVTQEMIADFQNDLRRPIEVNGKKYKYHPVTLDLEPLPQNTLPSLQDVGLLVQERKRLSQEIAKVAAAIREQRLKIQSAEEDLLEAENSVLLLFDKAEIDRLRAVSEGEQNVLPDLIQIYNDFEAELANAEAEFKIYQDDKDSFEVETQRIVAVNSVRSKAAAEEFTLLNRGQASIEKDPDETSDEFATRLKNQGTITYDDDMVLALAGRKDFEKGKRSLREVLDDPVIIETLLKVMTPEETFNMVKYWAVVKKKWLEIYGLNNETLGTKDAHELRDFIVLLTTNPGEEKMKEFHAVKQEEAVVDFIVPSKTKNQTNPYRMTPGQLTINFGREYKEKTGKSLPTSTSTDSVEKVNTNYNAALQGLIAAGLIPPPGTGDYRSPTKAPPPSSSSHASPAKAKPLPGAGIKHVVKAKLLGFGRVAINMEKLDRENVLAIMKHDGVHISGFKNRRVTDQFVEIVERMVAGHELSEKDLRPLDLAEREIFDELISLAGLHRAVPNTAAATKKALKQRFELVKGELDAGNTNSEIKEELIKLVYKMGGLKMITDTEKYRFIKDVKNLS